MTLTVITIIVAALPLLLTLLLRTSGGLAFLTLCAGSVLVNYVGEDAALIVSSFVHSDAPVEEITKIVLLVLPMLLTLILFRKSVQRRHLPLHIVSAALAGLTTLVLVQPLLSKSVQEQVSDTAIGTYTSPYQGFLVAAGLVISILALWLSRQKHSEGHGHKKGKH